MLAEPAAGRTITSGVGTLSPRGPWIKTPKPGMATQSDRRSSAMLSRNVVRFPTMIWWWSMADGLRTGTPWNSSQRSLSGRAFEKRMNSSAVIGASGCGKALAMLRFLFLGFDPSTAARGARRKAAHPGRKARAPVPRSATISTGAP
jgi:hypothetical protein